MKNVILIATFVLLSCALTRAQQPCSIMGQKNPHGMDMTISKVWVMDSANFMVSSVKKLPFKLKTTDTIWFDVCSVAHDGKAHSTQIRYMSDMGTISYNMSAVAPMAMMQVVSEKNPHPMNITINKVYVDDTANFYVLPSQTLPYVVPNGGMISFNLYLKATDAASHTAQITFETDMGTFTTNPTTMSASSASVSPVIVSSEDFGAFPNPAKTILRVKLPADRESGDLELYTTSGQQVYVGHVSATNNPEISVKSLPAGSYFLRFIPDRGNPLTTNVTISH